MKKLLIVLMLVLAGCGPYGHANEAQVAKAIQICEKHGGVTKIDIDGPARFNTYVILVTCKDKGQFILGDTGVIK